VPCPRHRAHTYTHTALRAALDQAGPRGRRPWRLTDATKNPSSYHGLPIAPLALWQLEHRSRKELEASARLCFFLAGQWSCWAARMQCHPSVERKHRQSVLRRLGREP